LGSIHEWSGVISNFYDLYTNTFSFCVPAVLIFTLRKIASRCSATSDTLQPLHAVDFGMSPKVKKQKDIKT